MEKKPGLEAETMAYRSLYRRWRPEKFADMVGQEHVRRTLQNALKNNRVCHAYLFTGPRGTGKTTAAKILARAVNCENGPAPEPCGRCSFCVDIAAGRSMDVQEIDAASNRGIDEIRVLREKVRYAPSGGSFNFFIIDEVHMLTNEAFNALLKTLEDPPPRVIFVLATTEPHKVPPTIVSRCQRFDFRLLSPSEIGERLAATAAGEGWDVEKEAVGLLSRLAEGSLRDALGLLEQCQAYGDGALSLDTVQKFLGVTAPDQVFRLTRALARHDGVTALATVGEIVFSGKDLALFVRDFTFFLSRLLLLAGGASLDEIGSDLPGYREHLKAARSFFSYHTLLEMIDILHGLAGELRYSLHPQFLLEIHVIRLLKIVAREDEQVVPTAGGRPEKDTSYSPPTVDRPVALGLSRKTGLETAAASSRTVPAPPRVLQEELSRLQREWASLLKTIKKRRLQAYAWLEFGKPLALEGNLLKIAFTHGAELHKKNTEREENRLVIEEVVSAFLNRPVKVCCEFADRKESFVSLNPPVVNEEKEKNGQVLYENARQLFKGKVLEAGD